MILGVLQRRSEHGPFPEERVKEDRGEVVAPHRRSPGRPTKNSGIDRPDKDTMLKMYEQMLLIRRFEEKAGQLYGMGQIGDSAIFISVRKLLLSACSR